MVEEIAVRKTKEFWSNSIAARLYRRFAGGRFVRMHRLLIEYLTIRKARSVLDIACGSGDFLSLLSKSELAPWLAGSDVASGMVAAARKRLGDRATILESSAERQPFADGSFEAVTVLMAFHHFPEPVQALKEIHRLLVPGGICLVADIAADSSFKRKFWNFLEQVTGMRGYVGHYMEEDMRLWSAEAGFTGFRSQKIPHMASRYRIFSFSKP